MSTGNSKTPQVGSPGEVIGRTRYDRDLILRLINEGLRDTDIAKQVGCSCKTVWAHRHGYCTGRRYANYTDDQIKGIIGLSDAMIKRHLQRKRALQNILYEREKKRRELLQMDAEARQRQEGT